MVRLLPYSYLVLMAYRLRCCSTPVIFRVRPISFSIGGGQIQPSWDSRLASQSISALQVPCASLLAPCTCQRQVYFDHRSLRFDQIVTSQCLGRESGDRILSSGS